MTVSRAANAFRSSDGLSGIKEAIAAAFPKTEYQRCIVHQVRNTLKYVPDKDRKAFAADLKTIYQASDERKALAALSINAKNYIGSQFANNSIVSYRIVDGIDVNNRIDLI